MRLTTHGTWTERGRRHSASRRPAAERLRLGERLRQLRIAAGLTQSELAGDRFSKEYVSQIERGKTRPTRETVEWLAARLGVDAGFLANGVAADERGRLEGALARAEALYEAGEDDEAVEAFGPLVAAARATGVPELQVRALVGAGLAKMRVSEHRAALAPPERGARDLRGRSRSRTSSGPTSSPGSAAAATSSTASSPRSACSTRRSRSPSARACRATRSRRAILSWRSRCWRRQRDYVAARDDVERALELARGVDDLRTIGAAYFQASLVAEREGHWVLARTYAERAREAYVQLADRVHVGELTNNLGGLNFLLGKHGGRGRAPQGGVRDRARDRTRRRRRPCRLLARADPPAHR